MASVVWGKEAHFQQIAQSVDKIGWRKFMEGVIPKELWKIQEMYVMVEGALIGPWVSLVHGCVIGHGLLAGTISR